MKKTGIVLGLLVAVVVLALGGAELYHQIVFGHFVGWGIHTDVVLGNSDVGTRDMYFAKLWNLSLTPFEIEGCLFANDVPGVPASVLYRWDVQKHGSSGDRWLSLHGADTWMPGPFEGVWREEGCVPSVTRVLPLHRRTVGWVYKDWVTTGEPVRMAIHTSATKPPEAQHIVYTQTFVVKAK